jgi:hypothetical protein
MAENKTTEGTRKESLRVVALLVAREACDGNPCFGHIWTECGCVLAAREIMEAVKYGR